MNRHTTFKLKKRLRVRLKNGDQFSDKLIDQTDKYLVFVLVGRVMKETIQSAAYFKAQQNRI